MRGTASGRRCLFRKCPFHEATDGEGKSCDFALRKNAAGGMIRWNIQAGGVPEKKVMHIAFKSERIGVHR